MRTACNLEWSAQEAAMLQEMGYWLWPLNLPQKPIAHPAPAPALARRPSQPPTSHNSAKTLNNRAKETRSATTAAHYAADEVHLEHAINSCKQCGLCENSPGRLIGLGSPLAPLWVVSDTLVMDQTPSRYALQQNASAQDALLASRYQSLSSLTNSKVVTATGTANHLLHNILKASDLILAPATATVNATANAPTAIQDANQTLKQSFTLNQASSTNPLKGPVHGVYCTTAVKCCPHDARNPQPQELAACRPFLLRQIELYHPKVIMALGRFALQSLLDSTLPLGQLRGRVHHCHGTQVIASYSLAYLLRSPLDKAKAWDDWRLAKRLLGGLDS